MPDVQQQYKTELPSALFSNQLPLYNMHACFAGRQTAVLKISNCSTENTQAVLT
jgi:hypothetical protein